MSIGIIIQARLSSTRLPKKIILEIEQNNTFLDVLLNKISALKDQFLITLATSISPIDSTLEPFAKKYDLGFYQGSETNVLDRFISCATENNLETIIRVCSDNPFLDINLIKELYDSYNGEDYLSFKINNSPSILTHYGFFAEIVSVKALKKVADSNDLNCIEHVTNCIYKNPDKFNVRFIEKKIDNNQIRCTLDTEEDLNILKEIYFSFVKNRKETTYLDIINYLKKQPLLLSRMDAIIKENIK